MITSVKSKLAYPVLAILLMLLAYLVVATIPPFWHHPEVDHRTLPEMVRIGLGMELTNLEDSLALTPITTGEEPFALTFSMPLKVDAACLVYPPSLSYIPSDYKASFRTLHLFDNGNEVDNFEIDRQTNNTYLVRWRTIYAPYGTNTLQMRLSFDYVPYHNASVLGPKRTEIVTNILQWDYTASGFERWAEFHGFLQVTSADYSIYIFNTNNSLMQRIDGHTDKGVIDKVWNIHPTNKYAWSDDDLEAKVYITPTITDTNGQAKSNAPTVCVPYP